MEARHIIAYSLLTVIALVGGIALMLHRRRLAARKRRLRGIKTDEIVRERRRQEQHRA